MGEIRGLLIPPSYTIHQDESERVSEGENQDERRVKKREGEGESEGGGGCVAEMTHYHFTSSLLSPLWNLDHFSYWLGVTTQRDRRGARGSCGLNERIPLSCVIWKLTELLQPTLCHETNEGAQYR